VDWNSVLPSEQATVVCGNPPFAGYGWNRRNRRPSRLSFGTGTSDWGRSTTSHWFKLAAEYASGTEVRLRSSPRIQYHRVNNPHAMDELWKHHMGIDFAYRTFAWTSEATGKASVHVVIVGYSATPKPAKLPLWTYSKANGPGARRRLDISTRTYGWPEYRRFLATGSLVADVPVIALARWHETVVTCLT